MSDLRVCRDCGYLLEAHPVSTTGRVCTTFRAAPAPPENLLTRVLIADAERDDAEPAPCTCPDYQSFGSCSHVQGEPAPPRATTHRCPRCGAACCCAEWYDGEPCYHHQSHGCAPRATAPMTEKRLAALGRIAEQWRGDAFGEALLEMHGEVTRLRPVSPSSDIGGLVEVEREMCRALVAIRLEVDRTIADDMTRRFDAYVTLAKSALATLTARAVEAERDAELGAALRKALDTVFGADYLALEPWGDGFSVERVSKHGHRENDATRHLSALLGPSPTPETTE